MDVSLSSIIIRLNALFFKFNKPLRDSFILSDKSKTISENFGMNFL